MAADLAVYLMECRSWPPCIQASLESCWGELRNTEDRNAVVKGTRVVGKALLEFSQAG